MTKYAFTGKAVILMTPWEISCHSGRQVVNVDIARLAREIKSVRLCGCAPILAPTQRPLQFACATNIVPHSQGRFHGCTRQVRVSHFKLGRRRDKTKNGDESALSYPTLSCPKFNVCTFKAYAEPHLL